MIRKNVAGQKILILIHQDNGSGEYYDGFPSITWAASDISLSKDGGSFANATNTASLVDNTNIPGLAVLTLTQAETNCDILKVSINTTGSSRPSQRMMTFYTDPPWEDNLLGSGHTIPGDSLADIRDSFDASVFPVLRSGQSITELSGSGWLSALVTKIRQWTDQPSTNSKFNSARILESVRESLRELFTDVAITGGRLPVARYTITVAANVQDYVLPPTVGRVLRVANIDDTFNRPNFELWPTNFLDDMGVAWTQEGNMLHLNMRGSWVEGQTLEVAYVPNGDIRPCYALASSVAADGTTVTLPTTALDGTIDNRPNALTGYLLRVVSASDQNYEQERLISSHSVSTRVLTLARPLSPIPQTSVYVEVVPPWGKLFEDVLAIHVARSLVASDVNKDRFDMLTAKYREKARALRLQLAKVQSRRASTFDGRIPENEERPFGWF